MSDFKDFLRYRALARRFQSGALSLGDIETHMGKGHIVGPNGAPATLEEGIPELQIRNLCAKVPGALIEELDGLLDDLKMSKRDFVEYAIREAMANARAILAEVGGPEFYPDQEG
jgi:hypothetical protein